VKALITRSRDGAAPFASALAARGIEPVLAPMLNVLPERDGAAQVQASLIGAQAILFTSANGVRAFATASSRRELPAFAVGDATGAAARLANFRTVYSAHGDVEDLAALVAGRLSPRQGALVHAAGRDVANDLAAMLAARGFAARAVVLYRAEPVAALPPDVVAALREGIALAFFFSPRGAVTFARLAGNSGFVAVCADMTAFAISAAVGEALGELAWRALWIAPAPTQAALLKTLDEVLSRLREIGKSLA
jgi:uroporphyrinogen-III synthase